MAKSRLLRIVRAFLPSTSTLVVGATLGALCAEEQYQISIAIGGMTGFTSGLWYSFDRVAESFYS